jgi:1-aminocyclopropane-1-carboxylate deaminase
MQLESSRIDHILIPVDKNQNILADVLRLDVIHPIISGNKWFKLQPYLDDALQIQKKVVVTFGGAYSNHIIATAAACRSFGLKSIGIIRGEEPLIHSDTLKDCMSFQMELHFVSRINYKNKVIPEAVFEKYQEEEIYVINEGGYGKKGVEGAQTIIEMLDTSSYTHICAAVGTGTMVAGLLKASKSHQQIIGISVLKNNISVHDNISSLLSITPANLQLLHDYHFGGYAKYMDQLIAFMNQWYLNTGIPSDFVYTGKLFFGVNELVRSGYFNSESKLLIIHSGGLQGNRSLPNGKLIF